MFDFVRNHTRLTLGFMLLLIIPSFVFFGVEGYRQFSDGSNTAVAKVDGRSITRAEWDNAHQRSIDRVRRQMPTVDVRTLDTPQARTETLDSLVRERVLLAAANAMHLTPSAARIKQIFVSDPQFAQMRNPDGSVNKELLAMQGMNSEMFEQQLRQEFAMQQVLTGVARSALAPASVAAASLDPLLQRREVQVLRFDPATYRSKVNPSEAEVEAYYKSQAAMFKSPEQASIEYVVLDLEALGKDLKPTEEELRKFYADNTARFTAPEERRASHILIKADKDASSAERAKAKASAEALLAEVRKNPASFADLARKNSQDGTAAQGGDLDFFGRGAMVKPFEDAAFSMKVGDISNVIETDFGYHVLTLTAMRGGQKQTFDEVRAEIETELRKSLAQKRWPELAEQFTNTVYEQSDSLQPVIDKLKLEKKTATVMRTAPAGATGPLASAKLLEAVFANEAVANKRNTDAVEVGPNQLVAARVVTHSPERTQPLADVKDMVRERLLDQQSAVLARKDGLDRLATAQKAPAESLASSLTVSRAQTQGLPRAVMDAVLRADASKLPAVAGVDLQSQGYVVVRVTQLLPRAPAPGGEDVLRGQYAQAWAAAESDAYLAALKKRYKVDIKPAAALPPDTAGSAAR
ncbi:MAG: SurA N-terminal domain-containing protein [Rubrivivax sp.]|jgi:peptidyl-prolyl cis-trans isomerase D|nr:SurA N-terminal domain-containing protein [Rubrivivax sp.]